MSVFHTRTASLAVVCAGLAVLASACASGSATPSATAPASNGISAKPAAQVVTTAYTAMESAVSVRVYGRISDSGQRYTIDLTMAPAGIRGSMTAPFDGAKAASVDMVLTKGRMYIRSNSAGTAPMIGNRWIIVPVGSIPGFPFTNAKTFINLLKNEGLNSLGTDRALGVKTTVNGQPAIEFSDKGTALYIASTGQPYPLEFRQGSGTLVYFQYSSLPANITAPPHPLDLSKLMQSGLMG